MIPPIVRAYEDNRQISAGKSIDYSEHNAATLYLMGFCSFVLWLVHFDDAVSILKILFLAFTTHWLIFDYLLNWLRDKPVLQYYGDLTDEKNLSFIEKHVYRRLGWKTLLVMKKVLFIISLIIYG